MRGLPGTKSGAAAYGRRGRSASSYAAITTNDAGFGLKPAKHKSFGQKSVAFGSADKRGKPKINFTASGGKPRRYLARPGSNAYHMLAAMGGVY